MGCRSINEGRTLAILVNTCNFPEHIFRLARAAHEKGIFVHVHFSGRGVLLADGKQAGRLKKIAEISVCRDSCEEMGLAEAPGTGCLVSPDRLIGLIQNCTRHVVL